MKKWTCCVLVGVLLLCCTACDREPLLSAAGEYNGQTITMSYTVTDVVYPWDMRSLEMQQGYAVFCDYTWYEEYEESGADPYPRDAWNILDRNGNRLLSDPYMTLASFNKDGITVAQKMDGSFVQLNMKLEETAITEQEYTAFCLDPKNNICSKTYPKGDYNYSCINNDIAIYVESKNETSYVGLVDKDGNVIIPAFIRINYNEMVEHLHLSEDTAFVEDAVSHHIGIITITRI